LKGAWEAIRYATYEVKGKAVSGVLRGGSFYPFGLLLGGDLSMPEFIEAASAPYRPDMEALIENAAGGGFDAAALKPLAPIPYPIREIICLGKNYADHVNEINATSGALPAKPVYFAKSAFSVTGPGETIPGHTAATRQIDYEAELAVVMGAECRNLAGSARGFIFGYTIINDVTARDLQAGHGQWYFGKSLDGFCPMGPVIVGADEFGYPPSLRIRSRVNGEPRQDSDTGKLIFPIDEVIRQLSAGIALRPGDIIATGTPAGVGHGFSPAKNLNSGDIVECEIEGIGILQNIIG